MTEPRRTPPQDPHAEQGLLAAGLLYGAEAVQEAAAVLEPGDFSDRRHGQIFAAMLHLAETGPPVDELTVSACLRDRGRLAEVGGPGYLAELGNLLVSQGHAESYARRVKDKARLRRVLEATQRAQAAIYSSQADDASAALAEVDRLLFEARQHGAAGDLVRTADLLPELWAAFEQRRAGGKDPSALPTGFASLDRVLGGGLRPGDLAYVAGRPGMGKSALLACVAANVAVRQAQPVLFASLEMTPSQLVSRLFCSESFVGTSAWGLGQVGDVDMKRLESTKRILAEAPLFWLGRIKSVAELASRARLAKAREGLRLVVFDYVQRAARRQSVEEIAAVSGALKGMALDLGVPVLAAVQLSREVEKRTPPEPVLSDLKGAGDLEQDADVVALLYRPGYYARDTLDQTVKVCVAKHRNGPTGVVELVFRDEFVRFSEVAA